MSEHMFSHGPDSLPPENVAAVLEKVADKYGLVYVTYPPHEGFVRWAFHGPSLGRLEEFELEARVRADLDGNASFAAWNTTKSRRMLREKKR